MADISDPQTHKITSTQLAVDAQVEGLSNSVGAGVRVVHQQRTHGNRPTMQAELCETVEQLLHRGDQNLFAVQKVVGQFGVSLTRTYREDKASQSGATRAWNLGTSLFYKAGSIPWRPKDLPSNYCFVGVSSQAERESLGLGLFIVRQIALAHGGSVTAESAGGRTRFMVTLPKA